MSLWLPVKKKTVGMRLHPCLTSGCNIRRNKMRLRNFFSAKEIPYTGRRYLTNYADMKESATSIADRTVSRVLPGPPPK